MSKLKCSALLITSLLMSHSSFSAENITVNIAASIPAADFYVRPAPGTNLSATQWLNWNVVTRELETWKTTLDMRNSSGGIIVRLDTPAVLYSANNRIDLSVILNRHEVSEYSNNNLGCIIVPVEDAAIGKRYELAIEPVNARPPAGSYSGVVSLIFEPQGFLQVPQAGDASTTSFLNHSLLRRLQNLCSMF